MTVGGSLRVVRAAMFAVVCVVLASVGHVLMSGESLPWHVLVLAFVAVGGAGWAAAGRERGHVAVVALTLAVQAALHGAFTLAQASSPSPAGPPGAESDPARRWVDHLLCGPHGDLAAAARAYDVAESAGLTRDLTLPPLSDGSSAILALRHAGHGGGHGGGGHDMAAMTGTASWGMLAAHVAAALLCGLWLAHGERALFRVLRAATDRVLIPFALRPAPPAPTWEPPRTPSLDQPVRPTRLRLLFHTLITRGPPVGAAVA
ncbi:hypothetical protein C6N75_06615 [Streptomyces solincola]|uniref:PE-PGRS family protein n=1 Tax=Streptomyces solincola TaxID=2100817 RepID=A0A2S9Q017_9ACTN|nr:hypothetical protein [Streptomyces solincola]PRH79988.1 hypothetical protein C6N75_06615 [Streptomyces solincola]